MIGLIMVSMGTCMYVCGWVAIVVGSFYILRSFFCKIEMFVSIIITLPKIGILSVCCNTFYSL